MLEHEYSTMHAQELAHWWFRGRRRLLSDLLERYAPRTSGSPRILDFGCGTGGNSMAYARVGRVVGLEPDRRAARFAAERARGLAPPDRLDVCRALGTRLPLRSASFDVVLASDVLEHIEDDASALQEIARVLRPDGVLVFTVPAHPWLESAHDRALSHCRRYRSGALRALLQANGFQVGWLSYWNTALFPAVAALRLLRRSRPGTPRSDARVLPDPLNELLFRVLAVEARVLRHIRLPFGVSLVGVASPTPESR
jgi:SAM-dependent methyltransferase